MFCVLSTTISIYVLHGQIASFSVPSQEKPPFIN